MSITTSADLVAILQQEQLLTPEQLKELAGKRQIPDPRDLVRDLVQRGWLTPFQVNRLLSGKAAELVLGAYVLLDRLGEGGMGAVYKARHRKMNRLVALKVIRKEFVANPNSVRRFEREVQAAAQLSHPNVVTAFDAAQVGETHFFAMEYVEGSDLAKLVKAQGPLPVGHACEYVRQAALGLQHAHEQHLVHRDIKPHNLLLTTRGVVKVLDMGLARLRQSADGAAVTSGLTQTGAVMGTPSYMAPEQALNTHNADIRADIYSLGCTLYFLLTGRPPFDGMTSTEVLLKHQMEHARPVEQLRPEVSSDLAVVVRKLMAKKPEERYQTPAEAVAALAPFAQAGAGGIPLALPVANSRQIPDTETMDPALPLAPSAIQQSTLGGGDQLPVAEAFTQFMAGVNAETIPAAPPLAQPVTQFMAGVNAETMAAVPLAQPVPPAKRPGHWVRNLTITACVAALLGVAALPLLPEGQPKSSTETVAAKAARTNGTESPPASRPVLPGNAFTNGAGIKMVPIPAGKFMMGSSPQEIERCVKILGDKAKDQLGAEGPEHEVEIARPFFMSATNVTLGQYRKFVNEEKYVVIPPTPPNPFVPQLRFQKTGPNGEVIDSTEMQEERSRNAWQSYPDDHPVVHVSWHNARDFCLWLSKKEGKTYRLPKEAEWEYCSRAGVAGLRYCFGNEDRELASYAWYSANSGNKTHPAGELEPNAWGLRDMHGNARTWCLDNYDPTYYRNSPKINPPGGAGSDQVIRGGSCNDSAVGCRSAFRSRMAPGSRSGDLGFRVVQVP
jgi:formylglycine-generating enzyme required for sulfatase activity/serine/threonine protein kinase